MGSLIGFTLVLFWFLPGPYNHPLAALLNKFEQLEQAPSPRLIFVGGSGLYCGLDSALVEKETGRSVVNMGLWAGFGIRFVLEEVLPHVRSGDVVVAIPEYGSLTTDKILTPNPEGELRWLFPLHPVLVWSNPFFSLKNMLVLLRYKLQGWMIYMLTGDWRRLADQGLLFYERRFDARGDGVGALFAAKPKEDMDGYAVPLPDMALSFSALEILRQLQEQFRAKGALLVWMYPAYPREEYERNREALARLSHTLEEHLNSAIAGRMEDYVFDYALFTNSVDHLNEEGRCLRTRRLISDISLFL